MNVPKIRTTEGLEPVTILPDEDLVYGFLYDTIKRPQDFDLVMMLQSAEYDAKKSGAILRRCLEGKARLIPVYPRMGDKEPEEAEFIGPIMDGGLFLVSIG